MKKIILLGCILLSILSSWWIFSLNIVNLAFAWEDVLFYSTIFLVLYFLVKFVGSSSDKSFKKVVNKFIEGESTELKISPGLVNTYGLLLITLLPLLFYFFLYAVYIALTFSYYGFIVISYANRVPVVLILAFFIIPLGTIFGILSGIFYLIFTPQSSDLGIILDRTRNKKLWELLDSISTYLVTEKIDCVVLSPDPGISVYLKGNTLQTIFGKGKKVLTLGLPSLYGMNSEQFKSILVHENGHFSNKDTQWSVFTFTLGNSLRNALNHMPGPSKNESNTSSLQNALSLNPGYWILYTFAKLYFSVTGGFSRLKEVMADINSIRMCGGHTFASALKKVVVNEILFTEIIEKQEVMDRLRENKVIVNFELLHTFYQKNLKRETVNDALEDNLNKEIEDNFSSHPTTKTRLKYCERFLTKSSNKSYPISSLFDDWQEVNEKVADIYNNRLSYLAPYLLQNSENPQTS